MNWASQALLNVLRAAPPPHRPIAICFYCALGLFYIRNKAPALCVYTRRIHSSIEVPIVCQCGATVFSSCRKSLKVTVGHPPRETYPKHTPSHVWSTPTIFKCSCFLKLIPLPGDRQLIQIPSALGVHKGASGTTLRSLSYRTPCPPLASRMELMRKYDSYQFN